MKQKIIGLFCGIPKRSIAVLLILSAITAMPPKPVAALTAEDGIYFYDNLEDSNVGGGPSAWAFTNKGNEYCSATVKNDNDVRGNYVSVEMTRQSGTQDCYINSPTLSWTPEIFFSYKFKAPSTSAGPANLLLRGNKQGTGDAYFIKFMDITGGSITMLPDLANSKEVTLGTAEWNSAQFYVNYPDKKVTAYLNGVKIVEGSFLAGWESYDMKDILFRVTAYANKGTVNVSKLEYCFDDFLIYSDTSTVSNIVVSPYFFGIRNRQYSVESFASATGGQNGSAALVTAMYKEDVLVDLIISSANIKDGAVLACILPLETDADRYTFLMLGGENKMQPLKNSYSCTSDEILDLFEVDLEKEVSPLLNPDLSRFGTVTNYESANNSSYFDYTYAAGKTAFGGTICFLVDNFNVWLKDERYSMENKTVIEEGEILVPATGAAAAAGMSLTREGDTVYIGDGIIARAGDFYITAGGKRVDTPVEVREKNGDIYIPLRQLAERGFRKYYFESYKGLAVISDKAIVQNDVSNLNQIISMVNYIMFDRPNAAELTRVLNEKENARPRVLFTEEDFLKMVNRAESGGVFADWSASIIKLANTTVAAALPKQSYDNAGLRMQGFTSANNILALYWAYKQTGDDVYAQTAKAHGLAMADFGPGTHGNWNSGQHFLECAAALEANGLIIDLFYDELDKDARDTIANAMLEYGLKPAWNHYYGKGPSNWPRRDNNWNIVCNAGVIKGAIALMDEYEPQLCADIIEKALKSSEYMMHSYAPEGAWVEGPSYWHYTVANNVTMCASLDAAFGTDFGVSRAPGFMNTSYFPLMTTGNAGAFAYHDAPVTYFANSSEMWWFASKNNDGALAALRNGDMQKRAYSGTFKDLLWYYDNVSGEEAQLPLDKLYKYTEVATMRSGWDSDAVFVAMHAGENNVPHGQLDAGTFEYEAFGMRFASEMGSDNYNMPGYFGSARYNYYVNRAEGHNVYVINPGSGHDQVLSAATTLKQVDANNDGSIYTVDLTSAYSNYAISAKRGFMLTQNRQIFVVQDEIKPKQSGNDYLWYWHTAADIEVSPDGKSVTLTRSGKKVNIYFESNVPFTIEAGKSIPHPNSPQYSGQLANMTRIVNKIIVKFRSGDEDITFRAAAVPEGLIYDRGGLLPISEWTVAERVYPSVESVSYKKENGADALSKGMAAWGEGGIKTVRLKLDSEMNPQTVTADNIKVCGASAPVDINVEYSPANREAQITLNENLLPGEKYMVLAGAGLKTTDGVSFHTEQMSEFYTEFKEIFEITDFNNSSFGNWRLNNNNDTDYLFATVDSEHGKSLSISVKPAAESNPYLVTNSSTLQSKMGTGDISVEFEFMPTGTQTVYMFQLRSIGSPGIFTSAATLSGQTITYAGKSARIRQGQWNRIRFNYNLQNGVCALIVNGLEIYAGDIPGGNNGTFDNLRWTFVRASGAEGTVLFLDNIRIGKDKSSGE